MLRGYAFNSSADFEVVRQIKEDLCYSKSKLLFIFNSILNSKRYKYLLNIKKGINCNYLFLHSS